MTAYVGLHSENWFVGIVAGICVSALLIGCDLLFQRVNLRMLNLAIIGLFVGYLFGQALVLSYSALFDGGEIVKAALYLFGLYFGANMTLRASDHFYLNIPFVRLSPAGHHKKDLLVDSSVLLDARIIDLCSSGLFDRALIVPRFLNQELQGQLDSANEAMRTKARKALDVLKKLEVLPELELRFSDTDFPEVKDPMAKMVRLARFLSANLLISDMSRTQSQHVEGVKVVNLQLLSHALKPLMQSGEPIKIKIQRYGKEPMQGVGYLDDGTMVVVNGGGQYLGETIGAWVLSVKHTTTGRIVFCNAEEGAAVYAHESAEE